MELRRHSTSLDRVLRSALPAPIAAACLVATPVGAQPSPDPAPPPAPASAPAPTSAASPTHPVSEALTVEGGAECVEKSALVAQVVSWLERDAIDARLTVHVRVDGDPPDAVSFVVKRSGQPAAYRQFLKPPESCTDVRAAVSLAIALAIDATILETLGVIAPAPEPPAQPEPKPEPKPEPPAQPEPKPEPPPPPLPPARSPIDVGAALDVVGLLRVLPAPAAGGYGGMWVRWTAGFELGFGVLATLPVETRLGEGTLRTSLVATRIDGCYFRAFEPAVFRSCVGVATGQVLAEGDGFDDSRDTLVRWTALAMRLGARMPVAPPLSIHLDLDGFSPIVRPRLDVLDPSGSRSTSESLPPFGAGIGGGALLTFP